jgi:5-methylcytosine-specific restriction endonuclease McrA
MRRAGYEFKRHEVYERKRSLNYRCERCGQEGHLEAHHRVPIWFAKRYPELTPALISSMANCEILCADCHAIADREQNKKSLPFFVQALFGITLEQESSKMRFVSY